MLLLQGINWLLDGLRGRELKGRSRGVEPAFRRGEVVDGTAAEGRQWGVVRTRDNPADGGGSVAGIEAEAEAGAKTEAAGGAMTWAIVKAVAVGGKAVAVVAEAAGARTETEAARCHQHQCRLGWRHTGRRQRCKMTAKGGGVGGSSSSGTGATDAGAQTETARSERFRRTAAAAAVILESKSQPVASWVERCSGEGGHCRRRRLGGRGRRGFHGASSTANIEELRGVEVRIEVGGVFVLAVPVGARGSATGGGNVVVGCGRMGHGVSSRWLVLVAWVVAIGLSVGKSEKVARLSHPSICRCDF